MREDHESGWRDELEALAAEQKARESDYQRDIDDRYSQADQKTREMYRHTLEHIESMQAAELSDYQAKTRVLLENSQENWRQRLSDAESEDMSAELKAALTAILGEEGEK